MVKVYHLSTCDTCRKIIASLNLPANAVLQDIKTESITAEQLEQMKQAAGSFETLFSRKALKFRALGLHEKLLTENDYRQLILEEYTFLRRPVIQVNDQFFVGNQAKTVEQARLAIASLNS